MKTFDLIKISVVLLWGIVNIQNTYAQETVLARKIATKEAKKAASECVQKTVKETVEGSISESVQKTIKSGVVEGSEKAAKTTMRKTSKELLEESFQKGTKTSSKEVADVGIKDNSREALVDQMTKSASEKAGRHLSPSDKYSRAKKMDERYTDPLERQRYYDSLNDDDRRMLDQYQSAKYTDNGFNGVPTRNGRWTGTRGDSRWEPDRSIVPVDKGYSNPNNKTWGQILDENGVDGIDFHSGEPDLEPFAKMRTDIDYDKDISEQARAKLLNSDKNRDQFHNEIFEKIARENNMTTEELKLFKERNNLVIHECSDCKTILLVPREIHDNISHHGGIDMFRKFNGL